MPVQGYASWHTEGIHAVPTGRYESTVPRAHGEHRGAQSTTVTTYNVAKEPLPRTAHLRDPSRARHRSSTLDANIKPIIVTTNHTRPLNSSSHVQTPPASARPASPSVRDPYRSSEETYYAQPASSMRARSHNRHHSHSSAMDTDDIYRLRDRAGDDRLVRAPRLNPPGDIHRPHSRQGMYVKEPRVGEPRITTTTTTTYENDYEYTKPSDLARWDLEHDRPKSRSARRESFGRDSTLR